jgi:hypothetical protein
MGGRETWRMPLSFVPSLLYGVLLCDENYKLTGLVALMGVVAAFRAVVLLRRGAVRMSCELALIPLLYALAGGVTVVFVLLVLLAEMTGGASWRTRALFLVAGCGLLLLMPRLAQHVFVQYPLAKLWSGANYYRFPTIFPFPLLVLWLSLPSVTALLLRFPGREAQGSQAWTRRGLLCALLALGTAAGLSQAADWKKEEVMQYDYHIRYRAWQPVIRLADRHAPTSPLSVAFLNLALCKEGLLPERMFRYYQNGTEGLLPSFARDFTLPMMAGEIYYHLGFINTAQRYAFESMEAIPDNQLSARAVKRLAETNLLNGQYDVARKYILLLRQTLYYRSWATSALACLTDSSLVDANPEWAWLRKYRTRTDFLFSEQEKDMMLGILLEQNPGNRPAYEYLLAYCLLNKDLEHFYRYYPLGRAFRYRAVPKSYAEALAYVWGQMGPTTAAMPYPLSDETKRQFDEYRRIYANDPRAEQTLASRFASTYWFYLHFRK